MTLLAGLLLGSIISSFLGAGTSLAGAFMNRNAIKEQNQTNIDLAQLANQQSTVNTEADRAFRIEAAQKAHQWEVADLKAAGLNPILAAGGAGAVLPGASVAQTNQARVAAEGFDLSGLTGLFNSMSNTMLTQALINGRMEPYLNSKAEWFDSMTGKNDFMTTTQMYQILNAMTENGSLTQSQMQLLTQLKNSLSHEAKSRH